MFRFVKISNCNKQRCIDYGVFLMKGIFCSQDFMWCGRYVENYITPDMLPDSGSAGYRYGIRSQHVQICKKRKT